MDLLLIFLVCMFFYVVGVVSGWRARERHAERVLSKFVEQAQEESKEVKKNMVRINIERHNDMFYVYDRDTNQFMAQGKTQTELEEILQKRFPGKRFGASEENLIEVGFLS